MHIELLSTAHRAWMARLTRPKAFLRRREPVVQIVFSEDGQVWYYENGEQLTDAEAWPPLREKVRQHERQVSVDRIKAAIENKHRNSRLDEIRAVLRNAEGSAHDVVRDAQKAIHEFAISAGVRVDHNREMLAVEFASKHFHPDMPASSITALRQLLDAVALK